MNRQGLLFITIICVTTLLITIGSGEAQQFYNGRRIRVIVSFPPGGGFDIYSRLIGRYLPKHVPGSPRVIVQNMPGGGTVIGANYLYRLARRDGTVVGIFSPMLVLRQVIGVTGIEFQSEKFNWLVASNASDVTACIATAASGVKNLDDAIKRKQPLIMAAGLPGASILAWTRAYKEILGANFKIVPGFPGTAPLRAAIERGEADGACWQWSSVRVTAKAMLETGAAVVFSQIGIKKAADLPHVDNALHRAKNKMDKEVLAALLREYSMGRSYVAPPDVPEDRVQLLRKAFIDTLRYPRLLEDANRIGLPIDPLPGEEVQDIVAELKKLPREVRDKVRHFVE